MLVYYRIYIYLTLSSRRVSSRFLIHSFMISWWYKYSWFSLSYFFLFNTNAISFFFSFFLCCTLLLFPSVRSSAHQFPSVINDTSGVYIKLNAELYHLLTLILHNFPIFFPFVQWQYLWIYIIYIYGRTLSLQFFFSVTKREGDGFHWESVWLEQRTRDAGHRSCLF